MDAINRRFGDRDAIRFSCFPYRAEEETAVLQPCPHIARILQRRTNIMGTTEGVLHSTGRTEKLSDIMAEHMLDIMGNMMGLLCQHYELFCGQHYGRHYENICILSHNQRLTPHNVLALF